ncbi:MAG: hypothetical protein JXQ26_01325 [Tissierellales bacterium]|nr:hypothetical protein [Tissierellales bacterium]MBN2826597.1 hypothetical protein [Tissierellales bacterium]
MNHLIAKLRIAGGGSKFRKILSSDTIYSLPNDLENHVTYRSDHNLDEDSWFGIENFSSKDYFISLLDDTFNSADFDALENINAEKIDYICSYQNNNEFHFQRVSKTQLINRKILTLGDSFTFNENTRIIIINDKPDAIYLKNNDILYFKNLSSIASIFKGIDELYKEATEEETSSFLQNDFILLQNDFSSGKVKKANRKRIALAMNTLESFDDVEKETVFVYIKDYCPELEFNESSFVISSEEHLKSLLFGIEQRYYTTPVKCEKRLANSVIQLGTV